MILHRNVHLGFFIASLAASATPAFSESYDRRSGLYESESGQNLSVLLEHISDNRYSIDLTTTVPMSNTLPGCGGGISGELAIEKDKATLHIPNAGFITNEPISAKNLEYCKVDLRFLDEYTIQMDEVSGCGYYHGASCSFSGTVVHEASGI